MILNPLKLAVTAIGAALALASWQPAATAASFDFNPDGDVIRIRELPVGDEIFNVEFYAPKYVTLYTSELVQFFCPKNEKNCPLFSQIPYFYQDNPRNKSGATAKDAAIALADAFNSIGAPPFNRINYPFPSSALSLIIVPEFLRDNIIYPPSIRGYWVGRSDLGLPKYGAITELRSLRADSGFPGGFAHFEPVPEPSVILGSLGALAFGVAMKKKVAARQG